VIERLPAGAIAAIPLLIFSDGDSSALHEPNPGCSANRRCSARPASRPPQQTGSLDPGDRRRSLTTLLLRVCLTGMDLLLSGALWAQGTTTKARLTCTSPRTPQPAALNAVNAVKPPCRARLLHNSYALDASCSFTSGSYNTVTAHSVYRCSAHIRPCIIRVCPKVGCPFVVCAAALWCEYGSGSCPRGSCVLGLMSQVLAPYGWSVCDDSGCEGISRGPLVASAGVGGHCCFGGCGDQPGHWR
jgi:hypothetical protein